MIKRTTDYRLISKTLYSILPEVEKTRTNVYVLENSLRILTRKYGFEKAYNHLRSTLLPEGGAK